MKHVQRFLLVMLTISFTVVLTLGCQYRQGQAPNSADNQRENSTTSKEKGNEPPFTEAQYQTTDYPFNRNNPKLMGLTLTSTKNDLSDRWGDPVSSFVIEDSERINVWEYSGFSVGYNDEGLVAFVEVSEHGRPTGIRGLQVGDNESEAQKALGQPDYNSQYSWGYTGKDTLLRLDLDPATDEIQSIKLFSHVPS